MLSSSDRDWTPVLDFFSTSGIDVGLLVPTQTGMAKSILDATRICRNAFESSGFHDFSRQGQGPENKRVVRAEFVDVDGNTITKASLYRPNTKEGDPRIWIYGLKEYASVGNLLIIIPLGDRLLVVNASNPYLWQQIEAGKGHAGELFRRPSSTLSDIEAELLDKLHKICLAGWHPTVTAGPTGVGMTLEALLNIPPNSSGKPDYKGIELKSKRAKRLGAKAGLQTIFAKTPDWKASPIGSARRLLQEHGYEGPERRQLYCTISGAEPTNGMGFWLEADPERGDLWCVRDSGGEREKLMYWDIETLQSSLQRKHRTTLWVSAETRAAASGEQFHYHSAELTRSPVVSQFGFRLHDGTVTLDLTLNEQPGGRIRDHGYLFRCKSERLQRVFPEPIFFDLSEDAGPRN